MSFERKANSSGVWGSEILAKLNSNMTRKKLNRYQDSGKIQLAAKENRVPCCVLTSSLHVCPRLQLLKPHFFMGKMGSTVSACDIAVGVTHLLNGECLVHCRLSTYIGNFPLQYSSHNVNRHDSRNHSYARLLFL